MRGGMGGLVVHDKENTPVRGKGKEGVETRGREVGSARRLSISVSKSRPHYLRVIMNRFQRKGGSGRGRITADRPFHLDGSPYELILRSDSEEDNRKSFVVYEDDVDSLSSTSRQPATEFESTGKVPTIAGSKNATLEKCRTLNGGGKWEHVASIASVQQESKSDILESFVTFRACNKARFSAQLKPPPTAPLMEPANQQGLDSKTSLETLAATWQRGGRRSLYTQRSLDTSELEDIEQTFREMDEEVLEKEMHVAHLEEEMHEADLENEIQEDDVKKEMQEDDYREQEELPVSIKASEVHEAAMVSVEEQANTVELVPEPFNSQDWELLSPRNGGLETEDETATVDLTTPQLSDPKEKLRLDQEAPLPEPTSVILELGASPDASDSDRAIEQLTPLARLPCTGCNSQDTLQQVPEEIDSQLAETVEAVQICSVELDPSRRRRESMQYYSNRHSPWLKHLVLSSFQSANQVPEITVKSILQKPTMSGDHLDRVTQLNVTKPLSPLRSSELDIGVPVNTLVESNEGGLLSTDLPSSSGMDLNRIEGDIVITDDRLPTCHHHATPDEFETDNPLTENEREMQTWRDSQATPRSRLSLPDQSPLLPMHLSAQYTESFHEKTSRSSLESPPLQPAELLGRVDHVAATPLLQKPPFDIIGMFPTPPRNPCLLFGDPFIRQMNAGELSRRWLHFCTSPSLISDAIAGNKKPRTVESALIQPTCMEPTTSIPSDQIMQRTTEADVLPNAEEEALSSDSLDGKTSMYDEDVLPNAEAEVISSDGLDGKASMYDEDVLPNAEAEVISSDGLDGKASMYDEDVLPNAEAEVISSDGLDGKASIYDEDVLPNSEEEALSSDDPDGGMGYDDDFDDRSNDTTCIVQTRASCADNDQEGTSALKECPQDDSSLGEDPFCLNLTPVRDDNFVKAIAGPAEQYSLTHVDEEDIDQFMSSLQLVFMSQETPGVNHLCVDRPTANGEGMSNDAPFNHNTHSPASKGGHLSPNKELITPGKDERKQLALVQDECTPVQQKIKRSRKSTRTKKVDSPLDAGSKWSDGKRKSTRIKSKPLDWWRGERMLYGRVHSTLNTLIGIKHLSPDPVWPRPQDRKNKMASPKFKVDSFVSDKHKELLRLAAQ